jgi:glycosyltransferase involved in cell wall biosynthesis
MLKTIAYVLGSFPEPSETFIADEALSVRSEGVRVCVMAIRPGNRSVLHPSARELLSRPVDWFQLGQARRIAMLAAFTQLLLLQPWRTLRTLRAAARSPQRWCYLQALVAARWCLVQGVQFLHAHFADTNLVYARAISDWSGVPYGVTTHRYDIIDDPLDRNLACELLRSASAVVTISQFNRQHMAGKYALPLEGIHVVHCGIDLARFAYVSNKSPPGPRPLRLLNVGRLVEIKGQDVLLNALARVRDRGVPFSLDIVGGGPLHDSLLALSQALGLGEQVRLHGAKVEAFVREQLEAADVFVLPSRSEGLPVACIEALAVGTPTIATRIFGIPELIDHGSSGILVAANDAEALADAICRAWADPDALQRYRVAGRHKVEADFDRDACTRQLLNIWSRVLE